MLGEWGIVEMFSMGFFKVGMVSGIFSGLFRRSRSFVMSWFFVGR